MKANPCTWNGKQYPSVNAAAKAIGISFKTMKNRLNKGYTCDDDMKRRFATPCEWNGKSYPSIREAARDNYISNVGLWFRIVKHGYKGDADMVKD